MKLLEAINILKDYDIDDPMNYNSIKIAESIVNKSYDEYYKIFQESSLSKDDFYLNLFMIDESDMFPMNSQQMSDYVTYENYKKIKRKKTFKKVVFITMGVAIVAALGSQGLKRMSKENKELYKKEGAIGLGKKFVNEFGSNFDTKSEEFKKGAKKFFCGEGNSSSETED